MTPLKLGYRRAWQEATLRLRGAFRKGMGKKDDLPPGPSRSLSGIRGVAGLGPLGRERVLLSVAGRPSRGERPQRKGGYLPGTSPGRAVPNKRENRKRRGTRTFPAPLSKRKGSPMRTAAAGASADDPEEENKKTNGGGERDSGQARCCVGGSRPCRKGRRSKKDAPQRGPGERGEGRNGKQRR